MVWSLGDCFHPKILDRFKIAMMNLFKFFLGDDDGDDDNNVGGGGWS